MKIVGMFLVILLIFSSSVFAIEQSEDVNLQELEYKKLVIEENAKTRADIKQYLDRKAVEYEKSVKDDIDDNLRVLDERIDSKIRSAGFKFGIIFFSGLIAGMMIVYLIKRRIEKVSIIKRDIGDETMQESVNIAIKPPKKPELVEKPNPQPVPQNAPNPQMIVNTNNDNMVPLFRGVL